MMRSLKVGPCKSASVGQSHARFEARKSDPRAFAGTDLAHLAEIVLDERFGLESLTEDCISVIQRTLADISVQINLILAFAQQGSGAEIRQLWRLRVLKRYWNDAQATPAPHAP
ncbi:MAG: hypothetical protein ABSE46_24620 [Terracidiphilus sp.]|jgi:hypothetical protein